MDLSYIMRIARGHHTQREWAACLGVHPQTVYRWERHGVPRRHFSHVLEAVRLRPDLARDALAAALGTTRERMDPYFHGGISGFVLHLCCMVTGLEEDEIEEWIRLA